MTSEDISDKFRTREIDRGDPVRTLLNSLTLDNIRDAAYLLAPTKKIPIKSHKTSLDEILATGRPTSEIVDSLLEVEARSPFKHCLVARCVEPSRVAHLGEKLKESLTANSFNFVVRYFHFNESEFLVTLEHTVTVKEWIEDEGGSVRNLEQYDTRHPIVLRVIVSSGLQILSYPGFSQGTGTRRSAVIPYNDLLTALLKALEGVGIESKVLPIREALKILMTGPNRRVQKIRADIEAVNVGRFDMSSLNQKKTIEESLADLIVPYMSPESSRDEFIDSAKRAINEVEANFMVLHWSDEAVTTRLRFWDVGCEMLITWHGEHPTYRAVDSILGLLLETQRRLSKAGMDKSDGLGAWITELQGNQIVRPATLAETFELTPSQARRQLVYAVKAGMLCPVYRLNSNILLEDGLNEWTENPKDLRKTWKTDDGMTIDGADPKNIEVAFRRVVSTGGRA